MTNYLFLSTSIILATMGQLLMKRGMMSFGAFPVSQLLSKIIPMFLNPYVFVGLACFGASAVTWLVVLSRMELSLVYPMVSVAYVIVALVSWIFFKENLTLVRWLGILVIMVGVFLISRTS
ncbi:MAG: EamA family transporter [Candidatus Saganbacteria bacterium]|nr:EamA family transporter [Candidatus Saganbacteria bacterium]